MFHFTGLRRNSFHSIAVILQGGFYIDFAQLHVQFYYNDMISFESHEQLDFGAYGSSSCSFQGNRAPRIPKRNCNSKIHHKLLSHHLLTDYTPKHRVYLFEGESRLLWALIHQNPPYFGYVKLNSSKWKLSNCSQQWTFRSSLDTEHLYTGAFTFDKHIYVVQETISLNGFRYPNVVRQIKDLTQLTFTSYKVSSVVQGATKNAFPANRNFEDVTEPVLQLPRIKVKFGRTRESARWELVLHHFRTKHLDVHFPWHLCTHTFNRRSRYVDYVS